VRYRIFLVSCLSLLVCLTACATIPSAARQMLNKKAPPARLFYLDGSELSLEALDGKHAVFIFWATWCGHSKGAIERFEKLSRQYERRRDLEFFAVSVDRSDDLSVLKSRITSQQLRSVTHIFSGNDTQDELYRSFHGEMIPYYIVIDPRGVVRVVSTSQGDVEEYLDHRIRN